ncbi:MAG: TetR/AcrR family transcriptional regulator C-terminal domain-containing protein, partial [Candidatus Accumulibacter sp.]|nr:TetR/AcrR family transcriptional regulator C-terminal domain-containing protein [Accumulibacter sp.]
PNKEALFAAAIEHQCATMTAMIEAIRLSPGDIARTLTDLGASYLGIVLAPDSLALFRVIVAEAPRFPELGRRFFLGIRVVASIVAERIGEAARAGEVDVGSVGIEAAATLFIGMIRAQAQLECLTHPQARPSAAQKDRWVRLAVTTFLKAFGVARD